MQVLHLPCSRTLVKAPLQNPTGNWSQSIQVFLDDGAKVLDLVLYSPLKQALIPEGDHRGPDIIEICKEVDPQVGDECSSWETGGEDTLSELPSEGEEVG